MIEKKLAPLIESLFPSIYREQGPNFIAFVKAYFEFLDENFQFVTVQDDTNFNVGDVVYQGHTQGKIVSKDSTRLLVLVDDFDTFKCITMCSNVVPITSSSGGSSLITAGGATKRLGVNFWARRLMDMGDVDQTLDLFILRFKEKYLPNIQFNTSTNKRLLVKNSFDLYRSKGTARSVDLFFRLIYGVEASVYYPGDDLFKLSDAKWEKPTYLELYTPNTSRIVDMIGKQITGTISGASAFVERYIKRRTQSGFVNIVYVSNVVGTFIPNEQLIFANTLYNDSPKVVGSLVSVTVVDGSTGFSVGSLVNLSTATGVNGIGRVTEINSERGVVRFELLKEGWGYTPSSNSQPEFSKVLISNTVITLSDVVSTNTVGVILQQSERLSQPQGLFDYTSSSGLTNGTEVSIYNGPTLVNSGTITSLTSTSSSNGTLQAVLDQPFNAANNYTIVSSSNTQANAVIVNAVDKTAIGYVVEPPSKVRLNVNQPSFGYVFAPGSKITQSKANGVIVSATLDPSGGIIEVANTLGVFTSGTVTSGAHSANVTSVSTTVGLYDVVNSFTPEYKVVSSHSNTVGIIDTKSLGSDANFEVGVVYDTEETLVDCKLLSTMANDVVSSWSTMLYNQSNFKNVALGSIFSFADINPGSGYTATPIVNVITPGVAALERKDYKVTVSNTTGSFIIGESVNQSVNDPTVVFSGVDGSLFTLGERVRIGNTVIASAANATVISVGSNTVTVGRVEGAWQSDHVIIRYANSQQNTTFTDSVQSANTYNIRGRVSSVVDNVITVERRSLYDTFTYSTIVGVTSGATGFVNRVEASQSDSVGDNAIVNPSVFTSNGSIVELEVVDSGYGFANNQIGTLTSDTRMGSFVGRLGGVGQGSGFYTSSRGFLSDSSKLIDGNYYQEYSYDVISSIPLNTYKDMFEQVMHVAGKKFFGNLLLQSVAEVNANVVDMSLEQEELSPFVVYSNEELVTERDGDEVLARP